MKRGEKLVVLAIGVMVLGTLARNLWNVDLEQHSDKGIPFYTTASTEMARDANDIYRKYNCKGCHTLWTVRNMLESVPAPALDGIGAIRSEEWLYQYLSSSDPQSILPSRLKQEFRMPSYASMPEQDRRLLARYLFSLKVQDWYLDETRKAEYEKLTGKVYHP